MARFLKWVLRVSDKKVMKGVPGVIILVCQAGVVGLFGWVCWCWCWFRVWNSLTMESR